MESKKQLWMNSKFWKIVLSVCAALSVSAAVAAGVVSHRSINALAAHAPETPALVSQYKAPAAKVDLQEITVYVTRTGSKYHCSSCQYLRQSKIPMPLKDARQSYDACSACDPPK